MNEINFKKVLVAVDDSEQALRGAEMAIRLSKASLLDSIVLFNAYENSIADKTKWNYSQKIDEYKNASQALLQKYEKLFAAEGINCQIIMAGGDAAPVIIDIVENDSDYDLIIIGSRRLNKLAEVTFGSVSDKITRLVNIPVLVIK